jgi:hypothetical protein
MREVGSTVGACISQPVPPCLGQTDFSLTSGQPFIFAPPIVDSVNQTVFVHVANNDQGAGHAELLQTNTVLSLNNEGPMGEAGQTQFTGAFDHGYFTSPSSGHLYVCGYANSGTASPVLYRFTFASNGSMNRAHDTNSLALASTTTATHCGPMTEFFNTTTGKDWLFTGVENGCVATGGTGCVMSMDITSGFPAAITQSRAEAGGTSGIVVDNVSSLAQASSIYFSTLSATTCGDGNSGGGCAVKMIQAGLN